MFVLRWLRSGAWKGRICPQLPQPSVTNDGFVVGATHLGTLHGMRGTRPGRGGGVVPGKAGWAGVEGLLQAITRLEIRGEYLMLQMAISLRRTLVEHSRKKGRRGRAAHGRRVAQA